MKEWSSRRREILLGLKKRRREQNRRMEKGKSGRAESRERRREVENAKKVKTRVLIGNPLGEDQY